jgi:protein Mpv17
MIFLNSAPSVTNKRRVEFPGETAISIHPSMASARIFSTLQRRYQSALKEHPIMTNIAQSFCLWTIGDALSQTFESVSRLSTANKPHLIQNASAVSDSTVESAREFSGFESSNVFRKISGISSFFKECLNAFDTTRCASAGLYGGLFLGTVGHQWYKGLDLFVSKVLRPTTTPSLIFAKVFLDTIIFGPIHVSAFFSWMELSKGNTTSEIKEKLSKDFLPTLVADSAYWIPVQILNFKFVPVPLQLTVVNVACIFECAGLSFLSKFGWGGHDSVESESRLGNLVEPETLFPHGSSSLVPAESHRGTL